MTELDGNHGLKNHNNHMSLFILRVPTWFRSWEKAGIKSPSLQLTSSRPDSQPPSESPISSNFRYLSTKVYLGQLPRTRLGVLHAAHSGW